MSNRFTLITVVGAVALSLAAMAPNSYAQKGDFSLATIDDLRLSHVLAAPEKYEGRDAVRITEDPNSKRGDGHRLAVIPRTDFKDGVIEVDLAGKRSENASKSDRGFVGIAFRVNSDMSQFECIYLRPTNGRADDQLRRNHSVQYESFPDFPWHRLRRETPGKYESYADLVPGQWTKMKIEISGTKARLYLDGAEQPNLIVNDLKLGEGPGAVAFWIGPGAEAYFSNLSIRD